ncbi:MAG: membrane integrity-associated transporter subunit PqiC [Proteobacteria bacterium]|nr:membrane integrity-associated transporter subunit PqiC [Pseudomonadota bacterium]
MQISRRRLAGLALPLALPSLAAACSSSPEPVLYTIQMKPGPVLGPGPRNVQVRDIGLASYLDRKEVVRSSEDYKLGVMANDWWGEGLGSMLGRVIVLGLSQRLTGSNVYAEGGAISPDANAVVGINVQRLDLDGQGQLVLIAQAAVQFERPRRTVSRNFQITKTPPTATVAGQVAASSEAVAELTNGVAEMLRA